MAEHPVQEVVILVADVTASVELYERLGNAAAFDRIAGALDRLRAFAEAAEGRFVQSRGDDVLCVFADVEMAADAALAMVAEGSCSGVALHVAVHRGEAIVARDSIFGDAVNVTYRLAALANSNEVLVTGVVAAAFAAPRRQRLRSLRTFTFKGRARPVEVFALDALTGQTMTHLPDHILSAASPSKLLLKLAHGSRSWELGEAESLSIGREDGVDVVIAKPWVSRHHAILLVRDGSATLNDRSTYGSFLVPTGGCEMRVRRQIVPLSGSGVIALGTSSTAPEAELLSYSVERIEAPARVEGGIVVPARFGDPSRGAGTRRSEAVRMDRGAASG